MKLSERAMLFKWSRGYWQGKIGDKKLAKELTDTHQAKEDTVTVTKHLIAKEALENVKKTSNEARTFVYKKTLPYNDKGWRILPATDYLKFSQEIQKQISAIEAADLAFKDQLEQFIEQRKRDLNGMFDPTDYPTRADLDRSNYVEVKIDPMPDIANLPNGLHGLVDGIIQDLETRQSEAIRVAHADLWKRLYDSIYRVVETLSDPEATFRNSLIGNIQDLINDLPRLNIFDDIALDQMTILVKEKLSTINPEDLRPKNAKAPMEESARKQARKETAEEAKAILKSMEAYFIPPVN